MWRRSRSSGVIRRKSSGHENCLRPNLAEGHDMGVSVLILTLDEEVNLAGCLDSVAWSDDVVVLDSFSRDGTVDIARARGVRLFQRQFDNYANQRNYGLRDITYKHEWVLMLDADERVPPELREEIAER